MESANAIDLHSVRPVKVYRMRGEDDGRSIDEDPYAEKERLQQKFISGNPEDEISKTVAGNWAGCLRIVDVKVITKCDAAFGLRNRVNGGTKTAVRRQERFSRAEKFTAESRRIRKG